MSIVSCEEGSSVALEIIDSLDENQAGIGRHKCVLCAYNLGRKDGAEDLMESFDLFELETCKHGQSAPKSVILNIHENQTKGQGRHKCAICAYAEGYKLGQKTKMKTKNIILYGAPGVGKTYNHKKLIALIESGEFSQNEVFDAIVENKDLGDLDLFKKVEEENRFKFVTFHQSYSYEDFIEGYRPDEEGKLKIIDGIFKEISQQDINKNIYLIIDEINRGNISKIFGELITLIEDDKRGNLSVELPYSREKFTVPKNLYIIATMNTTDKSIALLDVALRRRFTFLKMTPQSSVVPEIARDIFNELNQYILDLKGEDYLIGHGYFVDVRNEEDLEFTKRYKILPLLEEYFYGDESSLEKLEKILFKRNEEEF